MQQWDIDGQDKHAVLATSSLPNCCTGPRFPRWVSGSVRVSHVQHLIHSWYDLWCCRKGQRSLMLGQSNVDGRPL